MVVVYEINIYYGGQGVIDDPTLYVITKMADVFRELNVTVEQFNLYEQKIILRLLQEA